jgi:hypothetical protein
MKNLLVRRDYNGFDALFMFKPADFAERKRMMPEAEVITELTKVGVGGYYKGNRYTIWEGENGVRYMVFSGDWSARKELLP